MYMGPAERRIKRAIEKLTTGEDSKHYDASIDPVTGEAREALKDADPELIERVRAAEHKIRKIGGPAFTGEDIELTKEAYEREKGSENSPLQE
jgi:hypothetical protein